MSLQVAFLREGLAAEATGKAVVLVVSANVSVHVSFLREAFAADGARIRLFLCVNRADVCLQIALLSEGLAAALTVVVLDAGVNLYVRVHVALLGEALSADMANVGLVAGVDHHVSLEISFLRKELIAHRTEKLLRAGATAPTSATFTDSTTARGAARQSSVVMLRVMVMVVVMGQTSAQTTTSTSSSTATSTTSHGQVGIVEEAMRTGDTDAHRHLKMGVVG